MSLDEETISDIKLYNNPVIYSIYHISKNKYYVGSAEYLYSRIYSAKFSYFNKLTRKFELRNIHNIILKYGYEDFEFIIEKEVDSIIDIEKYEKEYIETRDSYFNGYNGTIDGKGFDSNELLSWIHKGEDRKMIPRRYLEKFLSEGWETGSNFSGHKNSIFITDGNITKRVHENELEYYESIGFHKGKSYDDPKLGRIRITNGILDRIVNEEDFTEENFPGFYRGSSEILKSKYKGKICMTNGTKDIRVREDEIDEYKSKGFYIGRKESNKRHNKVYIHNKITGKIKAVQKEDLESYLNSGDWIKGRF